MGSVCMIRSPMYRVELRSNDGDWLVAYMPIRTDGRYDDRTPGPHLVKEGGRRGGYGELLATKERYNRIVWGAGRDDSSTDLGIQPIRAGDEVKLFDGENRQQSARVLHIREVIRV
jgi:hypothetical protein